MMIIGALLMFLVAGVCLAMVITVIRENDPLFFLVGFALGFLFCVTMGILLLLQ